MADLRQTLTFSGEIAVTNPSKLGLTEIGQEHPASCPIQPGSNLRQTIRDQNSESISNY